MQNKHVFLKRFVDNSYPSHITYTMEANGNRIDQDRPGLLEGELLACHECDLIHKKEPIPGDEAGQNWTADVHPVKSRTALIRPFQLHVLLFLKK